MEDLVSGSPRRQGLGEARQGLQPDSLQYRAHRAAAPLHRRVRATRLHRHRRAAERLPAEPGLGHHLRQTGPGGLTRRRGDNRGRQGGQAQPEPRNPGHALHRLAPPGRRPVPRSQTIRPGVLRKRQRHRHSGYRDRPPVQGNYRRTHPRLTSKTPARKAPSAGECRFCPIDSQYCPDRREE